MKKTSRTDAKKQRVAIIGSRGIPAAYGGYETIAEELGAGLAKRGFEVYVSCESKHFKAKPYSSYKGMRLVYFPVITSFRNVSEVVLYDFLSVIWATERADQIYMLGYSSILTLIFPRFFRKKVLVNIDGLEADRRKFSPLVRFFYRSFEKMSGKIATYIIADSIALGKYYESNYGVPAMYIPNGGGGIREIKPLDSSAIEKFGISKGDYYLVLARLIPDNNIDLIIKGYTLSCSKKKLVIVGPLAKSRYVDDLLQEKNDNIYFLGGIYDLPLQRALRYNCYAYIHGHEKGGTNPSLVEALSCQNPILAVDVPFTREVAEDAAIYFKKDPQDIKDKIILFEKSEGTIKGNPYEIYRRKYSAEKTVDSFVKFISYN